jgi:L-amino acid N-acyltransferase YncA
MLSHTIKKYRPNRGTVMLGKVKPKNLRSIKVFTSLGFKSKLNKIYYFKKKY